MRESASGTESQSESKGLTGKRKGATMRQSGSESARQVNSSPFPVAMTKGFHLFPFRTQQLSPSVPKVLGWTRPGRIGRCRIPYRSISIEVLLFFIAGDGIAWLAQPSPWMWWAQFAGYDGIARDILYCTAVKMGSVRLIALLQQSALHSLPMRA